MKHKEEAGLLTEDLEENVEKHSRTSGKSNRLPRWSALPFGTTSYVLILLLTNVFSILATTYVWKPSNISASEVSYSPANEHISFETRWIDDDPNSHLYMGKPRPEFVQAWDELISTSYIRLSEEELQASGNNISTVAHKDGGYVAGIAVSHNLHCLRSIRQYLYPDYKFAEQHTDPAMRKMHLDHCLESFRRAFMCQVDYTLYTLEFVPGELAVHATQPHKCVDYWGLHEWMKERRAEGRDMVRPGTE